MFLYRFAILYFDTKSKIPININFRVGGEDDCGVGNLLPTKKDGTYIVSAAQRLKYMPKRTNSNLVVVSNKIRERLEGAIENYANALSIAFNCRRTISSGHPILAMRAENDSEIEFLNSSSGFYHKNVNCVSSKGEYIFDLKENLISLNDRIDGVTLLAESISNQSSTGKVHEFIRFYERAFGLAGRQLIDPMSAFLSSTIFGYNNHEITEWIKLRDGATHADRRNDVALEGDCAWKIARLEQASYDILLNKQRWHAADSERRNVWLPNSGTTNSDGDLFLRKGVDWNASFQTFDPFRRFVQHLEGNFDLSRSGLWIGQLRDGNSDHIPPNQISVMSGNLTVIDEFDTDYFLQKHNKINVKSD